MLGKISCISTREELESEYAVSIRHAHLYHPRPIVDGSEENILFIKTSKERNFIQPAIWGLLPQDYEDDWKEFQSNIEYLYVHQQDALDGVWWVEALNLRRCLIPLTGFYALHVHENTNSMYHVRMKNNAPMLVAGIYNITKGGYKTFSIILKKGSGRLLPFKNTSNKMPMIVDKQFFDSWLDGNSLEFGMHQENNIEAMLVAELIPTGTI